MVRRAFPILSDRGRDPGFESLRWFNFWGKWRVYRFFFSRVMSVVTLAFGSAFTATASHLHASDRLPHLEQVNALSHGLDRPRRTFRQRAVTFWRVSDQVRARDSPPHLNSTRMALRLLIPVRSLTPDLSGRDVISSLFPAVRLSAVDSDSRLVFLVAKRR